MQIKQKLVENLSPKWKIYFLFLSFFRLQSILSECVCLFNGYSVNIESFFSVLFRNRYKEKGYSGCWSSSKKDLQLLTIEMAFWTLDNFVETLLLSLTLPTSFNPLQQCNQLYSFSLHFISLHQPPPTNLNLLMDLMLGLVSK